MVRKSKIIVNIGCVKCGNERLGKPRLIKYDEKVIKYRFYCRRCKREVIITLPTYTWESTTID